MQFVLVADPTIEKEVTLSVPGGDPAKIIVFFKYKTPEVFAEWFELNRPRGLFGSVWYFFKKLYLRARGKPVPTAKDVCLQGIAGWGEVHDKENNPLPFSIEHLTTLLNAYPKSPGQLVQAYFQAVIEGHTKN